MERFCQQEHIRLDLASVAHHNQMDKSNTQIRNSSEESNLDSLSLYNSPRVAGKRNIPPCYGVFEHLQTDRPGIHLCFSYMEPKQSTKRHKTRLTPSHGVR